MAVNVEINGVICPKRCVGKASDESNFFLFFFGKMAVSVEINEVVCPTRGVGQRGTWDKQDSVLSSAVEPLLTFGPLTCGTVLLLSDNFFR